MNLHLQVAERRASPRYLLRIPVKFRMSEVTTDMEEHTTEATNISHAGMLLSSRTPLRIGCSLDLILRVPTEISGSALTEMRCVGHVIREQNCDDGTFGYGVRIDPRVPANIRRPAVPFLELCPTY